MADKSQQTKLVPTPLDGGWGWIVVIGSFISYFLADGWSYSFGVLFPDLLNYFGEGIGKTSLVAALLYGVPLLISPVICALTSCYGCRIVSIAGGIFTTAAMLLSAFATSVNFLCISVGVLASIGLAMTYLPAIIIVTFYFEKHRGLATGLAVTGSGLGTIAFPPLMDYLRNEYSWRGFLMITAGLCLHITMAGFLFRPLPLKTITDEDKTEILSGDPEKIGGRKRLKNKIILPRLHTQETRKTNSYTALNSASLLTRHQFIGASELSLYTALRFNGAVAIEMDDLYSDNPMSVSCPDIYTTEIEPTQVQVIYPEDSKLTGRVRFWFELQLIIKTMLDKSLMTNSGYLLFCASNFLLYLWVGVPYIFLIDRAINMGIRGNLFFLSSIIGIGRTIGQIIIGFLGDHPKIECNLLYGVSVLVIGIATILVPLCNNYVTLSLYSAVFGLFVSVTYAIQMMCIVDITGLEKATSGFGLLQFVQGIATILGTPLAGWLFDKTGGYNPTFYTSGAWMALSGAVLLPLPWMIKSKAASQTT